MITKNIGENQMKWKKRFLVALSCTFFIGGCTNDFMVHKQNSEIAETTSTNQKTNKTQNEPILSHR